MNTQEKETKLREAAKQHYTLRPKHFDAIDDLTQFAKSEAAREYHQQEAKYEGSLKEQFEGMCNDFGTCPDTCDAYYDFFRPHIKNQDPNEVDALELARSIWSLIPRECDSNIEAMEVAKKIIEELKPHLQPKLEGEIITLREMKLLSALKQMREYVSMESWMKADELLEQTAITLFKQSKTNSDDRS